MGLPPEVLAEQIEAERAAAELEVHEDNATTVDTFCALRTQWRVIAGGFGRPVFQGIDYHAVPAVLDLLDVPRDERAEVFAGLRLMEAAALPILNATPDE